MLTHTLSNITLGISSVKFGRKLYSKMVKMSVNLDHKTS